MPPNIRVTRVPKLGRRKSLLHKSKNSPKSVKVTRPGASIGKTTKRTTRLAKNGQIRSVRRYLNTQRAPTRQRVPNKQIKIRGTYNANIKYKNYGLSYRNPMDD